ncbi:hypothetical protein GCM10007859_27620 [Brevundimonas denitrificans]|uniref:Uncharacterized protein n=1 Tax=Brevundimonas denitrificans TaxID=1443434 RepID=A0ABQ6BN66_9CAUL|nr:hypothetical protein [Brevundimonas denitrificans]GLS02731.1 hypothetical protein GCM10007859_27620 [Brevundimonas denitrificans]
MTRDQLLKAKPGIVGLIREQAEKRLEAQGESADAQDVKGAAFLTAGASLAAAATALAAASMAFKPLPISAIFGASLAAVGFTAGSALAAWSLRSVGFHTCGWYPQDFAGDLEQRLSPKEVEADFVIALQSRLSENRPILERRGDRLNWSSYLMLATPIAALICAIVVA